MADNGAIHVSRIVKNESGKRYAEVRFEGPEGGERTGWVRLYDRPEGARFEDV